MMPIPLAVPLAMAGIGAIGSIFGSRGKKASGREKRYRRAFEGMAADEASRGTRFSNEYEQRALSYDPQESIRQSVTGAWNMMLPKLRAQQTDVGRLKTGFAAADENEYLSNLLASRAMEGEQLRFENMRDIGGYGERARNTALDAYYGQYATERASREQENASKRQMWGQLGGALIGSAGRVLAGGM